MKRIALKVDPKGRVYIPKQVREELGIKEKVSATIENGIVKIEPIENILDRLSKNVSFNFKSVKTDLPKLRKAAERELLKEV
jgi:AbrB family looped-hinge helix DNA binding protein